MTEEIILGQEYKDEVTGLQGIAIAKVIYLNGCIQYCIQPKVTSKGFADAIRDDKFYIDEGQLRLVGKGIVPTPKRYGGRLNGTPKGIGR